MQGLISHVSGCFSLFSFWCLFKMLITLQRSRKRKCLFLKALCFTKKKNESAFFFQHSDNGIIEEKHAKPDFKINPYRSRVLKHHTPSNPLKLNCRFSANSDLCFVIFDTLEYHITFQNKVFIYINLVFVFSCQLLLLLKFTIIIFGILLIL